MATKSSPQLVLDYEFLPVRAKILEIAASLDRLQRAGELGNEARSKQLREAISLLLENDEGRAERVQLLFSRDYDPQWQESLKLSR